MNLYVTGTTKEKHKDLIGSKVQSFEDINAVFYAVVLKNSKLYFARAKDLTYEERDELEEIKNTLEDIQKTLADEPTSRSTADKLRSLIK